MFLQPRIGTCRTRQDSSSRSQQVHPTCVRYVMPLAAEEAPLNGSTLSNLKGGRVIPVVGDGDVIDSCLAVDIHGSRICVVRLIGIWPVRARCLSVADWPWADRCHHQVNGN